MKLLITGASGSGTTTLGKALSIRLNWGFIDADDSYWLPTKPPYQVERQPDQRLQMILCELDKYESSIISGSVMNWGSDIEDCFDLIVFLYLETSVRIKRLEEREIYELGYADPNFLTWASEYDTGPSTGRSLSKHLKWLSERKCSIFRLDGDLSIDDRCEEILKTISNNGYPGFGPNSSPHL